MAKVLVISERQHSPYKVGFVGLS